MSRSGLVFASVLFLLLISVHSHGGSGDDDGGDAVAGTTEDAKPNLRSKSLILVKIWSLILIFVGTFVAGISPYFLKWNEGFLVLGTQFAGGVFLGTAMMHFLSDSNSTFGDLTDKEYPFAFMLACSGYLITMFADCLISHLYRKHGAVAAGGGNDLELQGKDGNNGSGQSNFQAHDHTSNHSLSNPALTGVSSLGDSILLIVALCFHSIFEGIAIGVAETKADAWKALWTISLHKLFAAIAMGIALLRIIPDRPLLSCAAYAFAFAISSPIGVAIGIIIDATTEGAVADWIYAISMGLACGVFVYVSINHLLLKGYVPLKRILVDTPFYRLLAVVLGVGVIAVVMIWDT